MLTKCDKTILTDETIIPLVQGLPDQPYPLLDHHPVKVLSVIPGLVQQFKHLKILTNIKI